MSKDLRKRVNDLCNNYGIGELVGAVINQLNNLEADYRELEAELALERGIADGFSAALTAAEKENDALVEAIRKLPVEEWVEQDQHGDPYLVGYVMRAQGEWDAVKALLPEQESE